MVPLDGVRLEGDGTRYFLNASAGGFSAVVSDRLEDEAKSAWGPLAYSWTALKSLPDLKEYRIRLRVDDGEEEALGAYNVVIANAGRIAGGIPVAPWAVLDDGLLDVLVIPSLPLARFTLVASQILLGSHRDHPDLVIRRGSKVSIESDPDVLLNTDGEGSAHSPATFTVLPRRVRFVVGDFPH